MNNTNKAKYELAKKMLKGKIDVEEVSIMTGIPANELEELNKEINPTNPEVEIMSKLDTVDLDLGPILYDNLPPENEEAWASFASDEDKAEE